MSKKKRTFWIIIGVIIIMQFFRIDKTNPAVNDENDFVKMYATPDSIQLIIKNSCYDCHSNETKYPWYSNVAPISWLIKHHIIEGREHLNFSEFGTYNDDQKTHALEEANEHIEKGKMPMGQYTLMHSEAKLSPTDKKTLIQYFESISKQIESSENDKNMPNEHADKEHTESYNADE